MGRIGRRPTTTTATATQTVTPTLAGTPTGGTTAAPNSTTGPYPDDNAKRMPVFNSPESIEAGRAKRREIMARSGRSSTRLVSDKGTAAFVNSFLGSS